jgi:hypothetical protein
LSAAEGGKSSQQDLGWRNEVRKQIRITPSILK